MYLMICSIMLKSTRCRFLDEAQEYWEEHFDDVVKDIKEYADSDIQKSIDDREASNLLLTLTIQEEKY